MAWPVCPIKALTGLCCPGCGGTRMVLSLLRGDLVGALRYNALTLVVLVLVTGGVAVGAVAWLRGRRSWPRPRWVPYAAGVVLLAWFVVRNVPGTGLYV